MNRSKYSAIRIKIRLFSHFEKYLPDPKSADNSCYLNMKEKATVREVLSELGMPLGIPKVIILNNEQGSLEGVLKNGDILTIIPPMAGG
jgi:molybdopterin converting factor small subunit